MHDNEITVLKVDCLNDKETVILGLSRHDRIISEQLMKTV